MRWLVVIILLFFAACIDKETQLPGGLVAPADHPLAGSFHTEASFPSMIFLTEKHHLGHNVQENKLLWTEREFRSNSNFQLHLYNEGYSIGKADIDDGVMAVRYELHHPFLATTPSTYRWPIPKITFDYFSDINRLEIRLSNNYYHQYFSDIELITDTQKSFSLAEHHATSYFGGEADSLLFTLQFERQLPLSEMKGFRIRWRDGRVSPEYPLRNYFKDSGLIKLQDYAIDNMPFSHHSTATEILQLDSDGFIAYLPGHSDHLVRFNVENPLEPSDIVEFPNTIATFPNPNPHLVNRIETNLISPRLRTVDLRDLSSVTRVISSGLDLNQELYGPVNNDFFGASADTAHTYLRVYNRNLSLLKEHKPLDISTVNVVFTPDAHAFINHPNRGANDGRLLHVNLQGHSLEIVHDVPHDLGRLWGVSEGYLIFTTPGHSAEFSLVAMSRMDKSIIWSQPLDMPAAQTAILSEDANLLVVHGAGFYRALRLSDGQVLINDFGKNINNSFYPPLVQLRGQKTILYQNAGGIGGEVRLP